MPKISVLIEIPADQPNAFETHSAAIASTYESAAQVERAARDLPGLGVDVVPEFPPVPMFDERTVRGGYASGFAAFGSPETNADHSSSSVVLAAEIDAGKLPTVARRPGVRIWANSRLTLLQARVDCRPFRPAVSVWTIRSLLGVRSLWRRGFRGQGIAVGIIDEGVNGDYYPVTGGFSRPDAQQPGTAPISSHGSMCAADVLVAAPSAVIYDYPFLGVPNSGGALAMFHEVLDQRRRDGTPHLTNNSYGFVGVPDKETNPNHEVHDINHPLHRKIREVTASGAPAFFAAGNCGADCPSRKCLPSGIGAGQSIHASNSLAEVITVAAVNSSGKRIGYSSQGPGMFEPSKPDIAAYSHFFGNFGPGRPAGSDVAPFDNGTSAASPLAAGVGALLMSAAAGITPELLKEALVAGAARVGVPGWNPDTGSGIIDVAASYQYLLTRPVSSAHEAKPAVMAAGL